MIFFLHNVTVARCDFIFLHNAITDLCLAGNMLVKRLYGNDNRSQRCPSVITSAGVKKDNVGCFQSVSRHVIFSGSLFPFCSFTALCVIEVWH